MIMFFIREGEGGGLKVTAALILEINYNSG